MKFSNIFRKKSSTQLTTIPQKLDKSQMSKVIGGGDGGTDTTLETTKTRAKIIMDRDSG